MCVINPPRLQLGKALLVIRPIDQNLQELVQRLGGRLRVAAVRVHVQRTLGGRIVQQQHARNDVVRLHRARDGAVRDEVLGGALHDLHALL